MSAVHVPDSLRIPPGRPIINDELGTIRADVPTPVQRGLPRTVESVEDVAFPPAKA